MISVEELHRLFSYQDGMLIRKVGVGKRQKAGEVVGSTNNEYVYVKVHGVMYKAHRLIWAMHIGEFPIGVLDHINGCKTDNRIENLRLATVQQNNANLSWNPRNTSGYKGVTFDKESGKWKAQIKSNGKKITVGRFKSKEEAHEAYCKKADELFGEFANYGSNPSIQTGAR